MVKDKKQVSSFFRCIDCLNFKTKVLNQQNICLPKNTDFRKSGLIQRKLTKHNSCRIYYCIFLQLRRWFYVEGNYVRHLMELERKCHMFKSIVNKQD